MAATDQASDRPGSLLQPIRSRVLREEVVDVLRVAILTNELSAGTRLVEEDVAEQMGTSRVPVREALRQLEHEGLVELIPHRGAIVAALAEPEIHSIYEIRATIEAEAMKRACELVTNEDLARLNRLCADMDHALRLDDIGLVADVDVRFHGVLLEIAGFAVIRRVWRSLDALVRVRTFDLLGRDDDLARHYLNVIVDRHRLLVDLLARREPEAAAQAVRAHIIEVRDQLGAQRPTTPREAARP